MKLYYSKVSPYVRKVLTVFEHHGLTDGLELQVASAFDPQSPHNEANVLGRIPALEIGENEWLYDSRVIAEYIDHIGKNTPLFPQAETRWHVLKMQALGDGIVDNAVPIVSEVFFREDKQYWLSRHAQLVERNMRTLDYVQSTDNIMTDELNIGTIALVCAIDWLEFRKQTIGVDVAKHFPKALAWTQAMNQKYDCLQKTIPVI